MSELSRIFDAAHLPAGFQQIEASEAECAALARRFALVRINSLRGCFRLEPDGSAVAATGDFNADIVQSCAVSGEDLPVRIAEQVSLRFVPAAESHPDEVELEVGELDEIEIEGGRFDLGEALAQSLALAIDPYAEGPGAEQFRREAGLLGEGQGGAFAALKGLLDPKP